ncbi:MAG: asparagine synthase-related protein [Actinomycetota bacterium]|nr:asparagine synthase-related protein [Actinomycetota bacterium]
MPDDAVAAFLHFGYLPPAEPIPRLLAQVLDALPVSRPPRPPADEEEVLERGTAALRSCFAAPGAGPHVVPLSAGLDSRAVLGGLLAAGLREDLVAVTVGTPGTFDFEIARRVAAHAGVVHEAIDLTEVSLDAGAMERAVVDSGAASWAFDVFFHRLIPARFGPGATYWSGFMGGELAGSHVPAGPEVSWPAAVQRFVSHARFCARPQLAPAGFDAGRAMPSQPWAARERLAYGDQLDFGVRQDGYVRRTVIVEGYDYRTPFLTASWLAFILSVPLGLRRGEHLFKRLLMAEYPSLFSLPTKNTAGLPLNTRPARVTAQIRLLKIAAAVRSGSIGRVVKDRRLPVPFRMLNYLDFPAALRSRPDMRSLVFDLVRALDERGVIGWLSGARLWAEHERAGGDFDLACALTLLASLEVNLRADASRATPFFAQR